MSLSKHKALSQLRAHFMEFTDSRDGQGKRHSLEVIFTIAILGAICGAEEWSEIEDFGKNKQTSVTVE